MNNSGNKPDVEKKQTPSARTERTAEHAADAAKHTAGQVKEAPVTYEAYYNMPDDGNRYEVADGKLELMSPGPTTTHQLLATELYSRLRDDCRNEYLIIVSPIDVKLAETEVRQPDIVLIRRDRMAIVEKRCINGSPDLVIEITGKYSYRRDKLKKTKVYAKYGVPEYWIVDPDNATLEQYVLQADGAYVLADVYSEDEIVRSERLTCAVFNMNELMRGIPQLPQ
ncbi:MAG: Uma2 family endonuclease [Paenibacillaceae bacterium]|nr:Uma2 family endonuclease [Paenibacillaceae bacterium]